MSEPGHGVRVRVEGGFVAALDFAGTPSPEAIRAAVNDALLEWYEREDAARGALDDALERAGQWETPTLLGQASLADPPAWVEPALRMLDEQPGTKPRE